MVRRATSRQAICINLFTMFHLLKKTPSTISMRGNESFNHSFLVILEVSNWCMFMPCTSSILPYPCPFATCRGLEWIVWLLWQTALRGTYPENGDWIVGPIRPLMRGWQWDHWTSWCTLWWIRVRNWFWSCSFCVVLNRSYQIMFFRFQPSRIIHRGKIFDIRAFTNLRYGRTVERFGEHILHSHVSRLFLGRLTQIHIHDVCLDTA